MERNHENKFLKPKIIDQEKNVTNKLDIKTDRTIAEI